MSQEAVEVVRGWYAAIPDLRDADPRDDHVLLDRAFHDYLDERYELRLPPGYPEGEPVFSGRADWPRFSECCGTLGRGGGSSRSASSMPAKRSWCSCVWWPPGGRAACRIEIPDAHVVTVCDGRITSTRVYRDRRQALEAVGLTQTPNRAGPTDRRAFQRGIRSSGNPIKMVDHAQGWRVEPGRLGAGYCAEMPEESTTPDLVELGDQARAAAERLAPSRE